MFAKNHSPGEPSGRFAGEAIEQSAPDSDRLPGQRTPAELVRLRQMLLRECAHHGVADIPSLAALLRETALDRPGYVLARVGLAVGDGRRTAQRLLSEAMPEAVCADDGEAGLLLLLTGHVGAMPCEQLERQAEALRAICGAVTLGLGMPFSSFDQLPRALAQAQGALGQRFFSRRSLLRYEPPMSVQPAKLAAVAQCCQAIRQCVEQGDGDGLQRQIEALTQSSIDAYRLADHGADRCRAVFLELVLPLCAHLGPEEPSPCAALLAAQSVEQLRGILTQSLLRRLRETLAGKAAESGDFVTATVLRYLAAHYPQAIDLGQIAQLVYMNASYVSRLLKKATGKTFTELLLEIRVENAKRLLETTTKKIYQVAEAVGIENSKYFSQVFRKATGLTPSEYRSRAGGRQLGNGEDAHGLLSGY